MNNTRLPRSPELMTADDSALLVVDVQEKLVRLVPGHERLVWNIRRLLDGAKLLGVPAAATEQYPQGLGPTTAELATRLPGASAKLAFSCGECGPIFQDWLAAGRHRVLVVGIETHVCIQQTVFDLLASGVRVYLAVDALGARYAIDHETALRRMDAAGAVLTTTEAALFEWCQVAGTPVFKQLSQLIREPCPGPKPGSAAT
ncbi:MAG: hydrolase [Planctomycetes bacterium]|nr:hydrolase [Planctomycetota bacterium]